MVVIERDVSDTSTAAIPRVWWLSPIAVSLIVAVASIVPTAILTDSEFRSLWRSPKSITAHTLLLFGCGAAAIAFGALVAMAAAPQIRSLARPWPAFSDRTILMLRMASIVLTTATVIGYAGFAALIVRAGINPFSFVSGYGQGIQVRDIIGTIPGVTTLTQFGIAAVVVSALLLTRESSRHELARLLTVLGLAVVRAYVLSERLAILELVVPVTVIFAARLAVGARRGLVQLIPFVASFFVVLMFGVFEYFRSWTYYRTHGGTSYTEFVLTRFAGYYSTALNNGHLQLEHMHWPGRLPYDTVEAFWVAPGIEKMDMYEKLSGHVPPHIRGAADPLYDAVLDHFGNPEFNNGSGYVSPFLDYGTFGGVLTFLLIGLVAGILYRGFRQGSPFGLLMYPVVFTGLLEIPRYFYWSQGRATYAWIGLVIVAVLISRSEAREKT
jgi:oligosaccharide repeat unit polymerase